METVLETTVDDIMQKHVENSHIVNSATTKTQHMRKTDVCINVCLYFLIKGN